MIFASAEFCPRCGAPLDTDGDESRLCGACGWFGESTETSNQPPVLGEFNPVLAILQSLALYRIVCRGELVAEQVYEAGDATEAELHKIRMEARTAVHALVELFTKIQRPHVPRQVFRVENGVIPWPPDWTDHHYNCNEPCDVLIGPCCCGSWHQETDEWVVEILTRHQAAIVP